MTSQEACPLCGSHHIGGLMQSFFVPLNADGDPEGDWNDWSSESELGEWRICYECNYEWESDR